MRAGFAARLFRFLDEAPAGLPKTGAVGAAMGGLKGALVGGAAGAAIGYLVVLTAAFEERGAHVRVLEECLFGAIGGAQLGFLIGAVRGTITRGKMALPVAGALVGLVAGAVAMIAFSLVPFVIWGHVQLMEIVFEHLAGLDPHKPVPVPSIDLLAALWAGGAMGSVAGAIAGALARGIWPSRLTTADHGRAKHPADEATT